MSDKQYCFFDLETTGKSVTADRIIQLSAIKLDEHLLPISDWKNIFVNPGMPISAEAAAVHGITEEMVKDKPAFAAYANGIFQFFSGCILCGYNIKHFDVPLLSEEFNRAGIAWPMPDVKIIDAYKIFSIKERRDLAYAYKFYTGHDMIGGHDAKVDVMATISVFREQMAMYSDLDKMNTDDLMLFCNEGVVNVDLAGKIVLNDKNEACYSFGKMKGQPVVSDKKYAEWVLNGEFSANTKNVVRALINK